MKKSFEKLGIKTQKDNTKDTYKIGASQKTISKAHNKIHKPNKYNKALNATNESKMYEYAEYVLREKSYAQQVKMWLYTLKSLRFSYPVASFVLACFAIWAYLTQSTKGTGLGFYVFFIVLVGLAFLIETGKSYFSEQYFTENKQSAIIGILIFMAVSITLSTYGMYEFTLQETDNSTQINRDYQNITDSTRQIYLDQITDLNATIEANRQSLRDKSKWVRLKASDNIEKAQSQKSELLALTKKTTDILVKEKADHLKIDFDKNNQNATYLALIIFLIEILYILSIRSIATIHKNLKTENRNFNKIQIDDAVQVEQSSWTFEQELVLRLLNTTENSQLTPFTSKITPQNHTSKMGFQFNKNTPKDKINAKNQVPSSNEDRINEPRNNDPRKDGNRNCKHCNELFTYNSPNHQYCSEKCRISAWEKRTGQKVKKKRSKLIRK